jgi:dGTPase
VSKKSNPLYATVEETKRPSGSDGARIDELGRSAFRKDYARLLHAASFRRLQDKTQLFPGSESDFFRNRLTHSLEVAQIAKGIASRLNVTQVPTAFPNGAIDEDLVEFAAIAHDLGHPPFGHNGEHALDELMMEFGGFEGNAQTLRILAAVERKFIDVQGGQPCSEFGLDLTFRTLASVLKYDSKIPKRKRGAKLHKGYYASEAPLVKKIKAAVAPGLGSKTAFKTIECAIMDIADDIAYSTYDLEDSLHAGFVSPMRLASALVNEDAKTIVLEKTNKALAEAGHQQATQGDLLSVIATVFSVTMPQSVNVLSTGDSIQNDARSALLVNVEAWQMNQKLQTDSLARTKFTADRVGRLIAAVDFVPCQNHPQLSSVRMQREEMLQVEVLKHLNYELVIRSPQLAVVENRGKEVVQRIFTTLDESNGKLLPADWKSRYSEQKTEFEKKRLICDYVACMTDRYAAELYSRLFGEGASIFKPL